MTAVFTLDTSGAVDCRFPGSQFADLVRWSDLSPFVQGTLKAAAEDLNRLLRADPGNYLDGGEAISYIGPEAQYRFDAWSPEALALILRDCEAIVAHFTLDTLTREGGLTAWDRAREGRYLSIGVPYRTPYLADDGKVHLREAAA